MKKMKMLGLTILAVAGVQMASAQIASAACAATTVQNGHTYYLYYSGTNICVYTATKILPLPK